MLITLGIRVDKAGILRGTRVQEGESTLPPFHVPHDQGRRRREGCPRGLEKADMASQLPGIRGLHLIAEGRLRLGEGGGGTGRRGAPGETWTQVPRRGQSEQSSGKVREARQPEVGAPNDRQSPGRCT